MAPARQPRGGGAAHRARRVPSTHAFDAADGARPAPAAAPSGPAAGRPDRSSRRPPWPAGTARRRDAVTMLRQRYDLRQWGKQDGVRRGRKNARPRYRGGRGYVHPAAPMATRARRRGVSRALRTSRKLPLLLVTHGQIGKVPALVGAREAALARPSGPGGGGGGGARRGRSTADTHVALTACASRPRHAEATEVSELRLGAPQRGGSGAACTRPVRAPRTPERRQVGLRRAHSGSRALRAHRPRTSPHRCAAALRLSAAPEGWSMPTAGVADESVHRRKRRGAREGQHRSAWRESERGRLRRTRCEDEQGERARPLNRGWAGGPPTVGAEGAEAVLGCRLGVDLRVQGRCAQGRSEWPILCAHCQISEQAQISASAACACPLEAV